MQDMPPAKRSMGCQYHDSMPSQKKPRVEASPDPADIDVTSAFAPSIVWSWVQGLDNPRMKSGFNPGGDFALDLELERGVLRIYGFGEGRDDGDEYQSGAESPSHQSSGQGLVQNTCSPSSSRDTGAPSSSPSLWGYGQIRIITTPNDPRPDHDCFLNVHPQTLERLLESYLEHIHPLHPLFPTAYLTEMLEQFCSHHKIHGKTLTTPLLSTPASSSGVNALYGMGLDRSSLTAVFLFIMALGSICQCKHESPRTSQSRNTDAIPGLVYYAPATDILGNLHGSSDLTHAQACLLAGLYVDQLRRPLESHRWVSEARSTCQILIQSKQRKHKNQRQANSMYSRLSIAADQMQPKSDERRDEVCVLDSLRTREVNNPQ
jgi:hypothetical protein